MIVLLVTSGINTIVNRLRAFLAPDVRARVAREMSAAHSSLARKIDVELHLHKARRRPASDVLYETLERYESIISTGSAVRLDRDLPNATALRSWFCGNDLDGGGGGGATRPRGDSDARNATATATWPRAVHIAPPDPTAPSPSSAVPDHVVDTLNNNDDEFLRRDTRSRAVMDLLDYQMTRLAESV